MRVFISLALLFGVAAANKATSTENTVDGLVGNIVETAQKINKLDQTMDSTVKKVEKSFEKAAEKEPLLLFKALPQRACPWSKFKQGADWKFSSIKSDDKEECARSCVATKGCTGFEVGPHTSKAYNFVSYCALWFNKKCNDENSMLRLSPKGYVATTFVMIQSVTVDVKNEEKTPFGTVEVEETETFQPNESKEHYKSTHVENTDPTSDKEVETVQPLLSFKALPQRACPWSQFVEGTDWKFASKTSDDKEECARSCVATKGCTGFEVGPHTSKAYNFVSYCALWFNKKCNNENSMLRLSPKGYAATTFVMAKSVTVKVESEEKTPLDTTTTPSSSITHFRNFPQLACDFADYRENIDWKYTTTASDDAEFCATACLNTAHCTGFEIGITSELGQYCALWKSGSCSTKKSMTAVSVTMQAVATFVLKDYSHEDTVIDGFTVMFLIACACALVISLLLVGCICYRVLNRVCLRRTDVNCNTPVVTGELVQAKVIHGTPVGQRVDVIIVRGEAVDQK